MLDVNKILNELKRNNYAKVFYFVPCGRFASNSDFEITIPTLNGNHPFDFYISSMQADEFLINGNGDIVPVDNFYATEEDCDAYVESTYDSHIRFPVGARTVCPSLGECFHSRDEIEAVGFYLCNKYDGEVLMK